MALEKNLRNYSLDQTDESQGSNTSTGIASCFVKFRSAGTVRQNLSHGYADLSNIDWWSLGLIDGDPPEIQNVLKSFVNKSGMITRTLDAQLTGRGESKIALKLKNITLDAIARSHGSAYPPIIATSKYPGTRSQVYTLSGVFTADGSITITFKTTNVLTGVEATTAVTQAWDASDGTTGAALLGKIKANIGIHATATTYATPTLTIVCKAGYFLTVTVPLAITGGTPPTISATVATDTSILSTTVDSSNGAISRLSLPLVTGGAAKITTAITNGTVEGKPGKPRIRILTGVDVTRYEYPHVDYVSGNMIYLKEPLMNLPSNSAAVDVVARDTFIPAGDSLPEDIEMQLDFRNHSDKSEVLVHIPCGIHDPDASKPANFGQEGRKCELGVIMKDTLLPNPYDSGATNIMMPYTVNEVYSATGTD